MLGTLHHEHIQSYFMRITEIKNDLLSIGEVIIDKELTLTALGGLPPEWYVFRTTILNNDQGFEVLEPGEHFILLLQEVDSGLARIIICKGEII